MNNDITWIIDFRRDSDDLNLYNQILSNKWCKIHRITDLVTDDFSEEIIKQYFDNYCYRQQIRDFWDASLVKNPKRINIFLIADDHNIFNASLFSFYLKSNTLLFFNQVGLSGSSSLNCNLISYWDSSWTKEQEAIKVNYLYSLNLIQNIPDIKKRPFDHVFIFKDINSGIGQFEYRFRNSSKDYYNSKICSLIYHISNVHSHIIRKNINIDRWCISFGAGIIYLDSETLYYKTAKELTNLIIDDLISSDAKPWEVFEDKPLMDKIKQLEFQEVFNAIKYQNSQNVFEKSSFYNTDFTKVWDWFGLSNLKIFFDHDISQLLFKSKVSKVDYLFDGYNEIRSQVEVNLRKLMDFKASNIKTPDQLFGEYFQLKPFSFQAYRIGLGNLIKQIEQQKQQNLENYKLRYPIFGSTELYNPCSMNPEVSKKYLELSDEFNDKDGLALDQKAENQLAKLKDSAAKIPHPLSLLFRTAFLSTLVILLLFIPLSNLFSDKVWLVYCLLTLLFVTPYILSWNYIKKSIKDIVSLSSEIEALSKYYITRKVIEYLYRSVDSVYDEYLNACKNELKIIENKIQEAEDYLKSDIVRDSEGPDKLSLRSATSIAESIPPVIINIDGINFETKDLNGNTEKLFQYFKQTILTTELSLNDLLLNKIDLLLNKIIDQLKSSSGNISSSSDLLFPKEGINIKNDDKEEFLNLLPPFNNGLANIDNITGELLLDSYKIEDTSLINEVIGNGMNTSIVKYNSDIESSITSGSISVLAINQPMSNLFGIFSTSLGGNKSSFIEITEKFEEEFPDKFSKILDKVIYETIVCKDIDATDKREEVFISVMKGFDLNFDENGWQTYFSDIDSLNDSYVKNFRKIFKDKFETCLSQYLSSKSN
jgi:hypothetical protein